MLQFTAGLPFLQCPEPSWFSFTVVNAAPLVASADMTMNSAVAVEATTARRPT
jgi:hypothetical protein